MAYILGVRRNRVAANDHTPFKNTSENMSPTLFTSGYEERYILPPVPIAHKDE